MFVPVLLDVSNTTALRPEETIDNVNFIVTMRPEGTSNYIKIFLPFQLKSSYYYVTMCSTVAAFSIFSKCEREHAQALQG